MSNADTNEAVQGELVTTGTEALEALNRSEVDIQIATAHRFPRSVDLFQKRATALACMTKAIAGSMFYSVPRGGKRIIGPSIRLAEVVASTWGNLRCACRNIGEDDLTVTSIGMCHDLETNVAITMEYALRITDKKGKRYNEDMIVLAKNNASARGLRNAIFRVVPRAYVDEVCESAKKIAVGDGATMVTIRENLLKWFADQGATEAQVLHLIGKEGVPDIDTNDVIFMRAVATGIKQGEQTVAEAFGPVPDPRKKARISPLNDSVGAADKPPEPEEAEEPEEPEEPEEAEAIAEPGPDLVTDCTVALAEAGTLLEIQAVRERFVGAKPGPSAEDLKVIHEMCDRANKTIRAGRGEGSNAQ
ncbi:hypothetical protein LCGC14_1321620 [marine sediment metagenome]|uniref:Uncharacterized protein n=1 Tax=marine sediment metagenome TaxID=412755 RepID=A0A0F9KJB5_9ZZZZ